MFFSTNKEEMLRSTRKVDGELIEEALLTCSTTLITVHYKLTKYAVWEMSSI